MAELRSKKRRTAFTLLALYLAKDLSPEVRMKDRTRAQIASLTQTRDTMVKLRTALKNKINNICSAHGINLNKESLASEKGLKAKEYVDHVGYTIEDFNTSRVESRTKASRPETQKRRPLRLGD